jgi:hypothetical protein
MPFDLKADRRRDQLSSLVPQIGAALKVAIQIAGTIWTERFRGGKRSALAPVPIIVSAHSRFPRRRMW